MAVATAIAAVGLAVSAGSAYQSNKNQKKALKANAAAAELDRKRMNLQSARERRDAIKASRLAYATSQQNAENQGAAFTSASEGGLGSIQSQLSANTSFLDKYNFLTDQASIQVGIAGQYAQKADTWNSVGGLAMQVFSNSNQIADVFNDTGAFIKRHT